MLAQHKGVDGRIRNLEFHAQGNAETGGIEVRARTKYLKRFIQTRREFDHSPYLVLWKAGMLLRIPSQHIHRIGDYEDDALWVQRSQLFQDRVEYGNVTVYEVQAGLARLLCRSSRDYCM